MLWKCKKKPNLKMFRRFSLFDSSPPSPKISINPPRLSLKGERKSPLKGAIINTLQLQNSPAPLLMHPDAKRSKSLDHATHLRMLHAERYQVATKLRTKSATLPPIINRQLPQASPTSNRWYNRLGNSFRRTRRAPVQYQVNTNTKNLHLVTRENFNCFKVKTTNWNLYWALVFVLHTDP